MKNENNRKTLAALSKGQKSNWKEEAEFRRKNRKWLRYSGAIAGRILAAIAETEGMNQKKLAGILGVSQQRISTLVKGQENLTIEMIALIGEALGTELISFPDYKYSKPLNNASGKKNFPIKKTPFPGQGPPALHLPLRGLRQN